MRNLLKAMLMHGGELATSMQGREWVVVMQRREWGGGGLRGALSLWVSTSFSLRHTQDVWLRVDEALDLFKKLARKHGEMQEATLNSVVRALTERYADRALRMLSLMRTLGMRPYHNTLTALIGSAARASRVQEAMHLYRQAPRA